LRVVHRGDYRGVKPHAIFASLADLLTEHDVPRGCVLHVGAHLGQEVPIYEAAGFARIVAVEPLPSAAAVLRERGVEVIEAAVSRRPGPLRLFETPWDQQSSILRPTNFDVRRTHRVEAVTLDDLPPADLLVVDVQGAEADVLTSGALVASLVIVEMCTEQRYRRAAKPRHVHSLLRAAGYRRVVRRWHNATIYDAAYVR
jgi:FkbM family methyltransferase